MTAPGVVVLPEQAWQEIRAELVALRTAVMDNLVAQSGKPVLAMSREEAAEALGLSLNSVDKLIQTGELPSAVLCGRRVVAIQDAKDFLAKQVEANRAAPQAFKRQPRPKRQPKGSAA